MNQLPSMKLPSLFQKKEPDEDWSRTMMLYNKEEYNPIVFHHDPHYYRNNNKMSTTTTDILLPPILTNPTQQTMVPLSPPYSTCSSASSLPSSPSSSSGNSFSSYSSTKKGSIQSLLNSGSELLQLEKQQDYYFDDLKNKNKKRSLDDEDIDNNCNKMQKINDHQRQIKGLRLFSKQVCDKVAEKRITTYNEVADELAADIQRNHQQNNNMRGIDQKNIRRRVYDALNVFMALNLISKNRKEIKWLGFNNQHEELLEREIEYEEARQKMLMDSIEGDQIMCDHAWLDLNRLNQLVQRNQQKYQNQQQAKIQFPFFLIQGQDIETKFHHAAEACITSTSSVIYKDIDVLAKIWPSPSTIVS